MGRRKNNGGTQEGSTGQPRAQMSPSQDMPRRKARKPAKDNGNSNGTNQQSQGSMKQEHPKQLPSQRNAITSQNGSTAEPRVPTQSRRKPSRRTAAGSGTGNKVPQTSHLPAPSKPAANTPSHLESTTASAEQAISHPVMIASHQKPRRQKGKEPGHDADRHLSTARYSRTTEPLLPYDVDGVSTSEQVDILRNTLHGADDYVLNTTTVGPSQPSGPIIQETQDYMLRLQSLVVAPDVLRQNGYVVKPLTKEELEGKKRCAQCGKGSIMPKNSRKEKSKEPGKGTGEASERPTGSGEPKGASQNEGGSLGEEAKRKQTTASAGQKEGQKEGHKEGHKEGQKEGQKERVRCKFHSGRVMNKKWSCCGNHVSSEPCGGTKEHRPVQYSPGQISRLWQFHATPSPKTIPGDSPEFRRAVAVDCEMGTAMSGDSELIRLTLIDYFSSSTLIDNLVCPDIPMRDYRTKYSGVTRAEMNAAWRQRRCIMGRNNARQAVWRFVGPNTVVVGHSAHNDLAALRWIHTVVVDSFQIESSIKEKEKKEKEETEKKEKEEKEEREKEEKEEREKEEKKEEEKEKEEKRTAASNDTLDEKQKVDTDSDGEKENKDGAAPAAAPKKSSSALPPSKPATHSSGTETKPAQQGKKKNKGSGQLSLKTLALARLGKEIQMAGKKGHDSLEDALAARDLVHWHVASFGG